MNLKTKKEMVEGVNYVLVSYKKMKSGVEMESVSFPANNSDLLKFILDIAYNKGLDIIDKPEHLNILDDLIDIYKINDDRVKLNNIKEELVDLAQAY